MSALANPLRGMMHLWSVLVVLGGGLVTLVAVALCLAPGDYLLAGLAFVGLGSFFTGLYVLPRKGIIGLLNIVKPRIRTIRHDMGDGTWLIEEIRR